MNAQDNIRKNVVMVGFVLAVMVLGLQTAQAVPITVPLTISQDPLFDPEGLAAEATFELLDPTHLKITLVNTSTGAPASFDNSDQILTGLSWDFGLAVNAIGVVVIAPGSSSINFSEGALGAGADVSHEWGYGNSGGTGMMTNVVSANTSQVTQFAGINRDGPEGLDGPQGGLVTDPPIVPIGGLGAVADSVVITLTLDAAVANLDFLNDGVVAEFGSDAAFMVPEPSTIIMLGLGCLLFRSRRK